MTGSAARALALCAVLVAAGCSGGDSGASTSTTTPPIAPSSTVVATSAPAVPTTTTTLPEPLTTVAIALEVDGDAVGDLVGDAGASGDPFADFASCSGSHEYFGAYAVLISTVDGPVRSVSILTNGPVMSSGVHEATVRVEVDDDSTAALEAAGTVTIDVGYRTGTFQAFTPEGTQVSGGFECAGGPDAQPLPGAGSGGGVSVTVEAFALVRMGPSQRILGFATVADDDGTCDGGVLVSGVDASISAFELTDEPSLRIVVGDVEYVVDELTVDGDDEAGSFAGVVDDATIDGAYRCT